MSSSNVENLDSTISAEELLGPPKVPFLSVLMMVLGAAIAGFVVGAIIFILLYIFLGKSALDAGASPILLSMVTFFALTVGGLIIYFMASMIFPEMYTRSMTAMSQVSLFSVILYILFAPLYLYVGNSITTAIEILDVFSLHVILSVFGLYVIIHTISQYRYVILSIYASFIGLIVTGTIWAVFILPLDASAQALVTLIVLVMLAFIGTTFFVYAILGLYYMLYKSTGSDFVGSLYSRIEQEEKELEQKATESLTKF